MKGRLRGRLRRRLRRPRLPRFLSYADLATLGNGLMGLLAIFTMAVETPYFVGIDDRYVVLGLVAVGAGLDGLDGLIARRFGASRLGTILDDLSDLVTFCVVPSLFLVMNYGGEAWIPTVLTASVVFLFGMMRLARFASTPEHDSLVFTGLPTPVSASAILLLGVSGIPGPLVLSASLVLAFLNVSQVPYPKARARLIWVGAVIWVTALVMGALLLFRPTFTGQVLATGGVIVILLVTLGPLVRASGRPAPTEEENGEADEEAAVGPDAPAAAGDDAGDKSGLPGP
ncbi:MAG: CDP-alcohol phosphatidyltransferase family protein [Methanobacteriota archaeon]